MRRRHTFRLCGGETRLLSSSSSSAAAAAAAARAMCDLLSVSMNETNDQIDCNDCQ